MSYPADYPHETITPFANTTNGTDGTDVDAASINAPLGELDENLQYYIAKELAAKPLLKSGLRLKYYTTTLMKIDAGVALSAWKHTTGSAVERDRAAFGRLAVETTKQVNQVFTQGNLGGGHYTATPTTGVNHAFLLINPVDLSCDVGFDDSPDGGNILDQAAVKAAGFTHCRRIGSFYWTPYVVGTVSGVRAFLNRGNQFLFSAPVVGGLTNAHAAKLFPTVEVPIIPGAITALLHLLAVEYASSATSVNYATYSSPLATAEPPSANEHSTRHWPPGVVLFGQEDYPCDNLNCEIPTDDATIGVEWSYSDDGVRYRIITLGWRDEFND